MKTAFHTLLYVLIASISFAQSPVDSTRVGTPVHLDGDVIFMIYEADLPYSVDERAVIIEKRLADIAKRGQMDKDSFRIVNLSNAANITYNGRIVMTVSEFDTDIIGLSLGDGSNLYLEKITAHIEENDWVYWLKTSGVQIGLTILVLILLYFIIRGLNKLFTRLNKWIIRSNTSYLRGIKIRNYEFLSKDRMLAFTASILKIIKWIIILLIVYLSLPLIFSIFPGTESITNTLLGYVLNPLKGMLRSLLGFIPNLVTILVIIGVTRYIVSGLRFLSLEIEKEKLVIPGFYSDWARPTYALIKVLIYAFAFIVIFPYLPGSDSPVFQGVSVFLGILVSLGSSSAISNLIAGLVITYMRAFKPGDRVKIGETVGDVIEKTMLITRVRTAKNEDVTIPNSNILNSHTVNYTSNTDEKGLILHTTITIGYDVSWVQVQELLKEAANRTENILKDPAPFILQTSLDDFYVSYELNVHTRHSKLSALIYSDLHKNILDSFHEGGVEIMSPHFRGNRDGSAPNIPKKLDKPDALNIEPPKDSDQTESTLD